MTDAGRVEGCTTGSEQRARQWDGIPRRIGTVTLLVEETFTNTYETACWYQQVRCAPQTVPLRSDGYWVMYGFEGVITKSYFPSRFGGYLSNNPQDEKDVGKPGSYSRSTYAYNVAQSIGDPAATQPANLRFRLDPEYGTASSEATMQDERKVRLWDLTVGEAGHPVTIRRAGTRCDPKFHHWRFVTFDVSYRGEPRGSVEVREGQHTCSEAQRAADNLVFGAQAQDNE